MPRLFLALALVLAPAAALAQAAYVPVAGAQHALSVATLKALTVPTGANYAVVCASGATVYTSTDPTFTPTTSSGQPLASGSCVSLVGAAEIANFRAIGTGATLDVEYHQATH